MYLRTTKRRRVDGSEVRYLQLAHNEWDSVSGQSRAKVLYNFGREDRLDRDTIGRLVKSLSRMLPPGEVLEATADTGLEFVESRPMGGAYVLDQLWRRLGIDKTLNDRTADRRFGTDMERVLFALVANRALAPSSKLAATSWIGDRVVIDGLDTVDTDTCYRAMDWLIEIEADLAEAVYWSTADLLNLEVDLLFFDTTSTYFESLGDDGDVVDKYRVRGRSKDHRPDLPQVVIGMAVTRSGIPIRVWSWPGNTADTTVITQVKDDLAAWKLARVVWVTDTGFNSASNRRYLQRAGGHYIMGERLRSGSLEATEAINRQGRYTKIADNLQVREVVFDNGTMRDRFVVCHNPEEAVRDAAVRDSIIAELAQRIEGSDDLDPDTRTVLVGKIIATKGLKRFLRVTNTGLLRIDKTAVKAEAKLDGKYLLRTSDPSLSTEDIALGYKQLLQVERGWRDMKQILDLRPVHHRLADRIHAHIVLCWLALLLIRITETETGDTWTNLRHELDRMHLGTFTTPAGTIQRRTATTTQQNTILSKLDIKQPPQFTNITPTPTP
jgi:Transposase DDE domain